MTHTPTVGEQRLPDVPLSLPEREDISRALIDNPTVPWVVIGRLIFRHPSTIARSREKTSFVIVGSAFMALRRYRADVRNPQHHGQTHLRHPQEPLR